MDINNVMQQVCGREAENAWISGTSVSIANVSLWIHILKKMK